MFHNKKKVSKVPRKHKTVIICIYIHNQSLEVLTNPIHLSLTNNSNKHGFLSSKTTVDLKHVGRRKEAAITE